jgi:hypothetical protein
MVLFAKLDSRPVSGVMVMMGEKVSLESHVSEGRIWKSRRPAELGDGAEGLSYQGGQAFNGAQAALILSCEAGGRGSKLRKHLDGADDGRRWGPWSLRCGGAPGRLYTRGSSGIHFHGQRTFHVGNLKVTQSLVRPAYTLRAERAAPISIPP